MAEMIMTKQALTPQEGGFLAAFSHSLNPYKGCAFGRTGCPFCYVRESPMGKFGASPWGTWVTQKNNIAEVLEAERRKQQARRYRVFMSSATDPYQPAEAHTCLSQRCLEVFQRWSVDWLVVQTRSLLVRRDLHLLAQLPFALLNISIETDLPDVHRHFTRSSAVPERRLHLVHDAIASGVMAQVTVSPVLPHSPAFAERLAWAIGDRGRVIIDTFLDGDSSGGRRSAKLGMSEILRAAGFPGWFERCQEQAHALSARLRTLIGPERVLWSAQGFAHNPFGDNSPQMR